ncbi:unnamed protein product [Amaranthus hypochondriacus]
MYGIQFSFSFQVSTDELVKEVESSIAEFRKQQQVYDEECVKEQRCRAVGRSAMLLSLLSHKACSSLLLKWYHFPFHLHIPSFTRF